MTNKKLCAVQHLFQTKNTETAEKKMEENHLANNEFQFSSNWNLAFQKFVLQISATSNWQNDLDKALSVSWLSK